MSSSENETGSERLLADATEQLIKTATEWALTDPDTLTASQTRRLIRRARTGDTNAITELQNAFGERLVFGTAGIRGRMGPGPSRMNRVVVTQTSAGFAAYLHERASRGETDTPPSVVIGYDGRTHSHVFAQDAAETLTGAGINVTLLPEPGPTPLTAFAVRYLGLSAGVMITASHNPPKDNGYKVYLGDADGGRQIAPPVDAEIAAHIHTVAQQPYATIPRSPNYRVSGPGVQDAYVTEVSTAVLRGLPLNDSGVPKAAPTPLRIAYTAMHGVGAALCRRVFTTTGLPSPTPVAEQQLPDGAFPTVEYPNPEEQGALDLAYHLARSIAAELVVAHDPDADRLAIAAPHPDEASGYRRLTGNELGLLLGWRAAKREHRRAQLNGTPPTGTLACTIVSSPALREVARDYGLNYAETLSGFKWVSRVPGLIFGYEEALGYLTHPEVVRDKDGISAAAEAVAMVRELKAAGRTVWDLLDQASTRFGHFASAQIVLRFDSMVEASAFATSIRKHPPSAFGVHRINSMRDLLQPGAAEVQADVLCYELCDGSRVMIRPSGTEPKLKIYLDTVSVDGGAQQRRETAEATLQDLEHEVRMFCAQDLHPPQSTTP